MMLSGPHRGPSVPGLVAPGNIDIHDRPVVHNADGSISTVRSISIGTPQGEVLIPTVVGGRVVSEKAAIAAFRRTGRHLGIFNSPEAANHYAAQLHEQQAQEYGPNHGTAGKLAKQLLGAVNPLPMIQDAPGNVKDNVSHLAERFRHPGRRPDAVPFEQAAQHTQMGVAFSPGSAGGPFLRGLKAKPDVYNNKFLVEQARRTEKTHGDIAEAIIRRKPRVGGRVARVAGKASVPPAMTGAILAADRLEHNTPPYRAPGIGRSSGGG